MMCKRSVVVLVSMLAVAVAGCSDDSGGGGGDGSSAPATFAEFEGVAKVEIIDLVCSATFDCPEKQSPWLSFSVGRFENKQACVSGAAEVLGIDVSDERTEAALSAGRLVYDADAAKRCLDTVASATTTCADFAEIQRLIESSECESLLVAQQDEGDPCNADDECVSGFCDHTQSAGECYGSCGAARDIAQEGEACDDAVCDDGLICAVVGPDDTVCVAEGSRVADGDCSASALLCADDLVCGLQQVCVPQFTYGAQGSTCSNAGPLCEPGLVCADLQLGENDTVEGTCEPPRGEGEACQQFFQCQIGLYCELTSQTEGTCEQRKQDGEPCSGMTDECAPSLFCDTSGDSPQCTSSDEQNVCEIPDDASGGGDAGTSDDTGTGDGSADAG